jgi:subtilisin family serine protease
MSRSRLRLVLATLLLSACGGGDGPTGPAAVVSVTIAAPTQVLNAIGESVLLTASGKDSKGRTVDALTFTWATANPAVATVVGGQVTAVGNGTTSITATSGAIVGTTQVTVQQTAATIAVTFAADTIRALGDTLRIVGTARDSRGNTVAGVPISYTTTNPAVVTIDGTGLMTAVTEGSATIRGTAGAASGERVVVVRQMVSRLAVSRQPGSARAGIVMPTVPTVVVQDSRGNPVNTDNTTVVSVQVAANGGVVVGGGTATAVNGVATFTGLAIGGLAGQKVLQFSAAGSSGAQSDALTLTAGDPTTVVATGGNNQTGLAGTVLTQALQVSTRDGYGNPVGGVPLAFAVVSGGGTPATLSTVTDGTGTGATLFTLPRYAGAVSIRASSSAMPQASATFSATATPNGRIQGVISGLGATNGVATRASARAMMQSVQAPQTSANGSVRAAKKRILQQVPTTLASPALGSVTKPVLRTVAGAMETPTPEPPPEQFVPGELLVTYKSDRIGAPAIGTQGFQQQNVVAQVRRSIADAIAPSVDDGTVTVAGVSPALLTARVRVQPGVTESEAIARLRRDPNVATVERNALAFLHVVPPTAMQTLLAHSGLAGDIMFSSLNALLPRPFAGPGVFSYPGGGAFPGNSLYVNQSWHYNMMELPRAWQLTQGNTNVIVAVIDDGIRFDHPAMAGVLTNDGYDFVSVGNVTLCAGGTVSTNGDGDGYDPDPTQPSSRSFNSTSTCVQGINSSGNHGLHVAGTVGAARVNAAGVVGVNWTARIRPIRVMGIHGSGSFYDISQGILYAVGLPADNGAGGTITTSGAPARVLNMSLGGTSGSTVLSNAVAQANATGAVIVASAGNNNNSTITYPASLTDVVSVAALAPTMERASYSTYGSFVKVAAPGGQVSAGSTHGVLSSTWNFVNGTPVVDSWQGTSMAAPHVAGVAALILAREPALTGAQVRQRLLNYAVDIGNPGFDLFFGNGLVNARNSLTSTFSPARVTYVRLVNATTGAIIRTVAAGPSGSYTFDGLSDGQYWVYAGQDEDGDGTIGLPVRPWSAFDDPAVPVAITVDGAGIYPASFSMRTPMEFEPNSTPELSDELAVDGYMRGTLTNTADTDFFRLRVGTQGTYRLQVTGLSGACRFALESDPILTVYSATGGILALNDDADLDNRDYCAEVVMPLAPGDYFLRVTAAQAGRYVISARRQ